MRAFDTLRERNASIIKQVDSLLQPEQSAPELKYGFQMTSQDLVRLRQFDQELREHFQSLRQLRGDRPLFLIEHGLDEIRLSDIMRHVGAQARLVGFGASDWLGASLSLAVFITEVGYGYRGNGTEFWPRCQSARKTDPLSASKIAPPCGVEIRA